MPELHATIGLPRSGKSTFCNEWVTKGPKRVIVCSDDIRKSLHGRRYELLAETMVFAIKHIMTRSLLNRGFSVIVDGTHSSEISIQRLLEIDKDTNFHYIDTDKTTCIQRAIKDNQDDLIPAIERINGNIEKMKLSGLGLSIDKIKRTLR